MKKSGNKYFVQAGWQIEVGSCTIMKTKLWHAHSASRDDEYTEEGNVSEGYL